MDQWYATDEGNVIYEEIEAELVVINLKSGCYYSLNDTASAIWRLVTGGHSLDQVSVLLAERFPSSADGMTGEVARIVSEFLREELLSPAGSPQAKEAPLPEGLAMPESFQAPVMTKHSDIQEMLQLDPIHEVTDLGWPDRK